MVKIICFISSDFCHNNKNIGPETVSLILHKFYLKKSMETSKKGDKHASLKVKKKSIIKINVFMQKMGSPHFIEIGV